MITHLIAGELNSYKDLPGNYYQIQTKVRDEIRPRFGVMRAKEFIMKDAYSFHASEESLDDTYTKMHKVYQRIFERCGVQAVAVQADAGMMGGSDSAEFMVLADSGEDVIVACPCCGYGANIEAANSVKDPLKIEVSEASMKQVDTPNVKTIEDVSKFLKMNQRQMIKTLFYQADEDIVCVLLCGDDQINETKLKNYLQVQYLALAENATVEQKIQTIIGFAGPVGLNVRVIADKNVMSLADAVTGANQVDKHLKHVNQDEIFSVRKLLI